MYTQSDNIKTKCFYLIILQCLAKSIARDNATLVQYKMSTKEILIFK